MDTFVIIKDQQTLLIHFHQTIKKNDKTIPECFQ